MIVIESPRIPLAALSEEIVGVAAVTVSPVPDDAPAPVDKMTLFAPVVALAGTLITRLVSFGAEFGLVVMVAAWPPIVTPVTPSKSVPLIVTKSPWAAVLGLRLEITGTATETVIEILKFTEL